MDVTVNPNKPKLAKLFLYHEILFYRINESEFIEFADDENHDDFYMIDDGRIHVQDQRGYYIMYQAAQHDLE